MGHRYFGTADIQYRDVRRAINATDRISQKTKDELMAEVDMLVGHMIDDFDFSLRNQYTSYAVVGSKRLKARHWFSDSRELLMEVSLRALKSCTSARKRFDEAGYVDRT